MNRPASIVDCAYEGLDQLYVRGICTDDEAVALASAYALAEREDHAGSWNHDVGDDATHWHNQCHHCPHTFTYPKDWDAMLAAPSIPDACPNCGARTAEPVEAPRYGVLRRTLARWGFADESSRSDGYTRLLHTDAAAKRGAFPIAILVDLDERDRERARAAAEAATIAEAVETVQGRYPAATDLRGVRCPHGNTTAVAVYFQLPGLAQSVYWMSGEPGRVQVSHDDVDTFKALYGAKAAS